MAGTKLFTVTMTFDQNLWNLRKWSIVWNYRRWLLLNEIISSNNCGWFGTGRRWLPHLWYCWMFPPQVIWGRVYGYCCLSSHTGDLVSLPVSPGGKAHGSKQIWCSDGLRAFWKSLKTAKIFFSFPTTFQQFVEYPFSILVPIRTEVSGNYALNESTIPSKVITFL